MKTTSLKDLPSRRSSIELTLSILDTINRSISNFRPSRSFPDLSLTIKKLIDEENSLERNEKNESLPAEIDVVISGGGLKGYYVCV
jgi:hypothetical protein